MHQSHARRNKKSESLLLPALGFAELESALKVYWPRYEVAEFKVVVTEGLCIIQIKLSSQLSMSMCVDIFARCCPLPTTECAYREKIKYPEP